MVSVVVNNSEQQKKNRVQENSKYRYDDARRYWNWWFFVRSISYPNICGVDPFCMQMLVGEICIFFSKAKFDEAIRYLFGG